MNNFILFDCLKKVAKRKKKITTYHVRDNKNLNETKGIELEMEVIKVHNKSTPMIMLRPLNNNFLSKVAPLISFKITPKKAKIIIGSVGKLIPNPPPMSLTGMLKGTANTVKKSICLVWVISNQIKRNAAGNTAI